MEKTNKQKTSDYLKAKIDLATVGKNNISYTFIPAGSTQGHVKTNVNIEDIKKELRNSELKFLVDENAELREKYNLLRDSLKTRIVRNLIPEIKDVSKIVNDKSIIPDLIENKLYIYSFKGVKELNINEIKKLLK